MFSFSRKFLILPMLIGIGLSSSTGWAASLTDKVSLQAVMQQHIDSQLVDGAYLRLETDTGEVVPLYPDTAHTIIFEMGEHCVLCYDFRDGEGSAVNVDFYLARADSSFVVFHTSIGDRSTLKMLMKEGRCPSSNDLRQLAS